MLSGPDRLPKLLVVHRLYRSLRLLARTDTDSIAIQRADSFTELMCIRAIENELAASCNSFSCLRSSAISAGHFPGLDQCSTLHIMPFGYAARSHKIRLIIEPREDYSRGTQYRPKLVGHSPRILMDNMNRNINVDFSNFQPCSCVGVEQSFSGHRAILPVNLQGLRQYQPVNILQCLQRLPRL